MAAVEPGKEDLAGWPVPRHPRQDTGCTLWPVAYGLWPMPFAPLMPERSPFAVLFDLDGTLVDSIELILSAARHAFASRPGPAPSTAEFAAGIGRPLVDQFGPYASTPEEMEELIVTYREFQLAHHDRLTSAYPGIVETVRVLANEQCAMAVVTSKMTPLARRSLAHVGLQDDIPLVIGCDATERHKPEPEPVLLALERLGASAGDAIFVGDSPYDMAAGRAAGVTPVAALWGAFPRKVLEDAGARYALDAATELPRLVRRLRWRAP